MKKGLMLIVLVAGLCGITKAQAQVEEVIIEQRLPGYKTAPGADFQEIHRMQYIRNCILFALTPLHIVLTVL